jgi:two-component system sensor histidine kinase VicK
MNSNAPNQKMQSIGIMPLNGPGNLHPSKYNNFSLDTIIAGSDIAVWSLDPDSMRINACPTFKRLLGLPEKRNYLFTELFGLIDQANRNSFITDIKNSCSSSSAFTVEFKTKYEPDAESKWFKLSGKASAANSEYHNIYMGTLVDITEFKTREIWNNDRLALLSHELKGPLSVMKLYLQRAGIIMGEKDVKDAALFLNKADEQVTAMSSLMDDLLSFSTAGNAKMKLCCEVFDMSSVVEDILSQMRMKHPTYRFSANVASGVNVSADRRKITQVLINYLSNAVKYSPENTTVKVRCITRGGQTVLSVSDNGIGIAEELHHKVFSRYYRIPGTKADGFGLGLYLVKEIINSHGGNVWLNSSVNQGSTFYFSIPSSTNNFRESSNLTVT